MTGNEIGDEGAKALSEMMKKNTTLTKLNLRCEEKDNSQKERKQRKEE